MFDKLLEAQQKAQEIKDRLDHVSVTGDAEGGKVRVVASANKEIKEIKIEPEFLKEADFEEIEE
ncbi:MAG: YbaB/EbfC family nucleoid-associated protein, partial [Sphingobacterium sp.]